MRDRLAQHLRDTGLLDDCQGVLVAVSGGLDSVVLLHLFRFSAPPFRVYAAHYDHRMRAGSAGDALWVRGLCRAWSVPLSMGTAERVPGSEAEARDMRYEFLLRTARERQCDAVLTAHHADDQAETVLFRLARGTGIGGLQGIRARRGIIVRPLLPFTRVQLEAWARRNRLGWREDPTNVEHRYARNRIRHVVLPALEQVSPGAAGRIAAVAARAVEAESAWHEVVRAAVEDVVETDTDGLIELARDRLLGYHPHIRARVIRHLLARLGPVPDKAGTRVVMEFISGGSSGTGIEAGGGARVEREFERIRLRAAGGPTAREDAVVIRDVGPGQARLSLAGSARQVKWGQGTAGVTTGSVAAFDTSALRFPLVLRGWQPGDRVRLPYGSKKVKKLFQERRVGRASRARVPVLVDAAGSVLWVVGVARSVLAPPPQLEQRVFSITVMDGESF